MPKTPSKSAFSQAQWIWTPGETKPLLHVACFRQTIELDVAPRSALLHCCADSFYRLYVNGQCAGMGPARGRPEQPYYDTHDISKKLRKGKNAVAFLVASYSAGSAIFHAVQGGLICQIEASGSRRPLAATDATWRAWTADAYWHNPGVLYSEGYDARKDPEGWQSPEFNDRKWSAAIELRESKLAPPSALLPRPIPFLSETPILPARLLDAGVCEDSEGKTKWEGEEIRAGIMRSKFETAADGIGSPALSPQTPWQPQPVTFAPPGGKKSVFLVLDFGKNTLASTEFALRGPAGAVVDVASCEMLRDDKVVSSYWNCLSLERIILRKGETVHRFNQRRGQRFVFVRISSFREPVTLVAVRAIESIYPAKQVGKFSAADPALDRIYQMSARTVNLCMEDAFTDCPWRERSQWLGDLHPEALINYYTFAANDLARKSLWEFGHGHQTDGWIPGVYPSNQLYNLPTWGMRYPVVLWEYYLHTDDRKTLEACREGVEREMHWLSQFDGRGGLFAKPEGWMFVDWTKTDWSTSDGAVQGWYLEAVLAAGRIAATMGDHKGSQRYAAKAAQMRASIVEAYWSKERGAFLKYSPWFDRRPANVPPDLIGQHENFLFPLLGVGTHDMRRSALAAIAGASGKYLPNFGNYQSHFTENAQKGNSICEDVIRIGSPFWSFYALQSLMEAGEEEAAIEYIRIAWGMMLDNGATSCWEMWDRNSSVSHGWSGAPAYMLPAYVLGVKPVSPGFGSFIVQPRLAGLSWAKGAVPTPHGSIGVEWEIIPPQSAEQKTRFVCVIVVPEGTRCAFRPPSECVRLRKSVGLAAGEHRLEYPLLPRRGGQSPEGRARRKERGL